MNQSIQSRGQLSCTQSFFLRQVRNVQGGRFFVDTVMSAPAEKFCSL